MAQPVSKITFADKTVISTAFLVAVLSLVCINLFLYKGKADGVEIQFDGMPYAFYLFSELPHEKTLEINTNIGYNIIRIEDNTVEITDSTCKDGLCRGVVLSKPNQSAVCLPNKLLVRLTGNAEVDSVSY